MGIESRESYESLCEAARQVVPVIDCDEFEAAQHASNAITIDVREPEEWENGILPGATLLPRGLLERDVRKVAPNMDDHVLIYCATGKRSLLAAATLRTMGYQRVTSMAGGFKSWQENGRTAAPGPAGARWLSLICPSFP